MYFNRILESRIKKISKQFGTNKVLDDLSLDVYEGEILGLIGRSGCGKSTLIKILVGYYNPDSGNILFKGKDITSDFNEVKGQEHVKRAQEVAASGGHNMITLCAPPLAAFRAVLRAPLP